jgi:hypothetical protein
MTACLKCDFNLAGNESECPRCGVILSKARPRPAQQPEKSDTHILFFLGGVACLFGIMPIAIVTWQSLGPGRYPVLIVGLPALPLVWLSAVCFRRSGLKLEEYASRNPASFKLALYLVFGFLAVVSLVVLSLLGLL